MNVIKITPRGYCHGVVYAMNLVAETIENKNTKKPIYILGQIVHNQNITDAFEKVGVITLEGKNRKEILNQVDSGTVIITAHGIDRNLIKEAKEKGLNVVDATCSDVYKTHDLIEMKLFDGYEVIYIGKKNHPEPEGVLGLNKDKIHLVENNEDVDLLDIKSPKICITNQTTMSMWDTEKLMQYAEKKYPNLEKIEETCKATQLRQEAVLEMAKKADLTIVVGDPKSNNSNKLVEISSKLANTNAIRINKINELDINLLLPDNINNIAVTSGASTPTLITKEVIEFIEKFDKNNKDTWTTKSNIDLKRIIPRSRGEK